MWCFRKSYIMSTTHRRFDGVSKSPKEILTGGHNLLGDFDRGVKGQNLLLQVQAHSSTILIKRVSYNF